MEIQQPHNQFGLSKSSCFDRHYLSNKASIERYRKWLIGNLYQKNPDTALQNPFDRSQKLPKYLEKNYNLEKKPIYYSIISLSLGIFSKH